MLTAAVVAFLAAAMGGIAMATRIFQGRRVPSALAAAHGLLAATGLVLVLWAFFGAGAPVGVALSILVLAGTGGIFLVSFHLRGKPHPKAVVVIHAVVAVIGVAALWIALV